MLQVIEKVNHFIQPILWGWPVLICILLAGILFTVRLRFFQFTKIGLWMKLTFAGMFRRKKQSNDGISPFQALTTALAGSIGTGNIVGVATALTLGGPGAIFWMWISALLGMMTIYAETVLGMKYRKKDKNGKWLGGAMYYIEYGLKCKPLAIVFAIACVLASFGMGNMAQANAIGGALRDSFGVNTTITGVVVALVVFIVLSGGIQRIAKVTEKVVPIMAGIYLLAGIIVIAVHGTMLPSVFGQIFSGAFNLQSATGGISGSVMMIALRNGVSRGIFTNEAGLGSSVMAHTEADCKEPAEQGMWGIFQVFTDTIVMCTITALCILCSGAMTTGKDGGALSTAAFHTVFGVFGDGVISVSITLFAFATMLGWSHYGQCGLRYLCGDKLLIPYRILFAFFAAASCGMDLTLVWDICDTLNGFMAIPNLVAIFLLSNQVIKETKEYLSRRKEHNNLKQLE